MRTSAIIAFALTTAACDPADPADPAASFRGYEQQPLEDFAPMCEAPPWVIWNDDFPNRPVDCVQKATLCIDQLVGPQCAYGDPVWSCWAVFDHCVDVARKCLQNSLETDDKP